MSETIASAIENTKDCLVVVYFWASFHEACKEGGQMDQVIQLLQGRHQSAVKFLKVDAEECSDLAEKYGVSMVPTFVSLYNGKKLDMVEGANPGKLQTMLEKDLASIASGKTNGASSSDSNASNSNEVLEERLRKLTHTAPVVLFMKGNAAEPRCKFSRAMVELLNEQQVKFVSFDILQDPEVREGLKTFANWKTYPQLWANGSLIGGMDSVRELVEKGEFKKKLSESFHSPRVVLPSKPPVAPSGPVDDNFLRQLVSKAPLMLFMKGEPDAPACGFSSKIVALLKEKNYPFESFNILENDQVRQGLKKFSNWPTYPQLYCDGKLVGGLDIVQELADEDELDDIIQPALEKQQTSSPMVVDDAFLTKLINKAPLMLFMKGYPDEPACGFSSKMVALLKENNFKFETFNILENEQVRQELKKFSNWPTYPQLYCNGKLVGGLDIVQELAEDGELMETLAPASAASL